MNGLTTIAALPVGGGCLSRLAPEVGKEAEPVLTYCARIFPDDSAPVWVPEPGQMIRIMGCMFTPLPELAK